ncbi:helix-turn-helix domain-containing protein [Amycolatopsis sp. CA-128772]|uniref:helix-turn-helix domain-containing protein n=1 Tax=Amycolatopsis sp. CA-128772 TaxID=2073159 RepID=UPI000CCFED55|nr:helix-turn-helix domain-containing protein [Amycolatopsis sp. CA-128772]
MFTKQPALHESIMDELISFATDLRWVRRLAGDPSYRELTRTIPWSPASITRNLSGTKLPTWKFVEQFLQACEVDDDDIEADWKPRWVTIAGMITPIDSKTAPNHAATAARQIAGPVPAGAACEICGAWVVDHAKHDDWHESLLAERKPTRSFVRRLAG